MLNVGYLLLLGAITLSNIVGPETWWYGSANLYLPQWVWALPGLLLLPVTFVAGRRLTWLPLVGLIYVAGPLMGYCWNPTSVTTGKGVRLRVMTYNIKWNSRDKQVLAQQFISYHPDLLQVQDGSNALRGPLGHLLDGWNVRTDGQYLVASPYPISGLEPVDLSFPGEHHHGVRATLTIQGVRITVVNVHLLSPRSGIQGVKHRHVGTMAENAGDRLAEAAELSAQLREIDGPTIVTGDLNSPVQSLACRSLLDVGYHDAFSTAGNGYGFTYGQYTRVGAPFVRIDHILYNEPWQALHCEVGDPRGSDHSPVIADLLLPQRP